MSNHEFNNAIREFGNDGDAFYGKLNVHESTIIQNPPKQTTPERQNKLLITEEHFNKSATQDMAGRMMTKPQKRDLSVSTELQLDAQRQLN